MFNPLKPFNLFIAKFLFDCISPENTRWYWAKQCWNYALHFTYLLILITFANGVILFILNYYFFLDEFKIKYNVLFGFFLYFIAVSCIYVLRDYIKWRLKNRADLKAKEREDSGITLEDLKKMK